MTIYKRGDKSPVVGQIQKALHLVQDNIFGSITEEAVKAFQTKNHLKPDGMVGPATLAKLLPCWFRKSKRTIKEIIVHCSATPEGKDFTVNDIRRWHKAQGWSDIGYHFVIYRNGHIEPGRDVDLVGAHCTGHNIYSIGICYIGGMDRDNKQPKDTRTLVQKAALLSLLTDLKMLYPEARIYGHRDFAAKACPSFDATKEYKNL